MKTIKIVCVDNLDSVNRSQLKTFSNILKKVSQKEEWKNFYNVHDETEDSFIVDFNLPEEISLSIYNEIVINNNTDASEYKTDAKRLLTTYFNENVDGLLFVVDLCLDSQNLYPLTGKALIQALKLQTSNPKVAIVACTGVNELDRYSFDECKLFHRCLTGENKMNRGYRSFDDSPELGQANKITDDRLKSLLIHLMTNDYRNIQYFSEILSEAMLMVI